MLASFWFVSWYTDSNPFLYFLTTLLKRMATTSERLTTSSAFNFWYLIHPFPSVVVFSSDVFMGLPYKVWGWIIFAIVMVMAVKLIKNNKLYSLLAGMFVVSFGGYLFLTEMHERYAFSGIALLLFLAVIKKKYFKYFLALSTIYFINLVWVFSFPQSLDRIKVLFMLEYQIIPRILSFLNVAIFLKIYKLLLNERQTEAT